VGWCVHLDIQSSSYRSLEVLKMWEHAQYCRLTTHVVVVGDGRVGSGKRTQYSACLYKTDESNLPISF